MRILGITRRIDELGRVVIPKEIRKKLRIKYGDLLEIYINDNETIILKKYSLLSENKKIVDDYIKILSKRIKAKVFVTDLKEIILSSDDNNNGEEILCDIENLYKTKDNLDEIKLTKNISLKRPFKMFAINPNGDLLGFLIIESDLNEELINFSSEYINKYFENN